jgi:hypothetical protein
MSLVSSAALCAVIAAESSVLLTIVSTVRRIKEQYDTDEQLADARSALLRASSTEAEPVRVPPFTASMIDRQERFTERHLQGSRSVVLFVDAALTLQAPAQEFCATLAGLRGHSDHCVYVVCEGSDEHRRQVQRWMRQCGASPEEFPIVAATTEDGKSLADLFQLERRPAAVRVDAEGVIVKVGYQVVSP